jgi:hypothetical protein
MNEQIASKLISDAISRTKTVNLNPTEKLKVGQLRALRGLENNLDSRYVVILNVNVIQRIAHVALISNLINFATDRDYVCKTKNSNSQFDFAILADFQVVADFVQLEKSKVVGEVCALCSKYLYSGSKIFTFDQVDFPKNHECLVAGDYPIQLGDGPWSIRSSEFELINSLCPGLSTKELTLREVATLKDLNSISDFINLSSDVFNKENILQMQDISLDLIRC